MTFPPQKRVTAATTHGVLVVCCIAAASCTEHGTSQSAQASESIRPPGITLAIRNGNAPPLDLAADQEYVFDRISLETERGDLPDSTRALEWLRTESGFRALDWSGVREARAHWRNYKSTRLDADVFSHVFEGAAWMAQPSSLKLSFLDATGAAMGEPLGISNDDFLNRQKQWDFDMIRAEFRLEGLTRHKDLRSARTKRAVAKVVFAIQTNLAKRLRVPAGARSLRIVWDKTPNDPYDVAIRLMPQPLPYGLQVTGQIEPPKEVYQPGDAIRATFTTLDGQGRPLKLSEFQSNGLTRLYVHLDGPRQEPTFYHEESLNDFRGGRYAHHLRAPELGLGSAGGSLTTVLKGPPLDADGTKMIVDLHVPQNLPSDAYGTYVLSAAAGRSYGSQQLELRWERPIQVGTARPTSFEEFGCVACHAPSSPTDLALLIPPMSGIEPLDVRDLQDCVFCHDNSRDGSRRLGKILHLLHTNRPSFPVAKNNCAVCHVQQGTIRKVGYESCEPCHQGVHDDNRPNYTDAQCQQCHGDPTRGHIVRAATTASSAR